MAWGRIRTAIYTVAGVGTILGACTPTYIIARLPHWPIHLDATHVVPFNNHGTIHYMERVEGIWVDNFWWVFLPCFFLWWITIAVRQWGSHRKPVDGDGNKARF